MTKRIMSGGLLLLLCGAFGMACKSKMSTLTYKMKNIASDSLIIIRKVAGRAVSDTSWVGYNQVATIAVTEEGSGHVSKYRPTGILTRFDTLLVYKIHYSKMAKTDFRNAELWTYHENHTHSADVTTTIADKDF